MMQFFVGFSCAVLSGLGIGGGGLLVIWLVLAEGAEQLPAQGTNLVFFLFSSGAAMLFHLMRRRLNFPLIGWLALCGIVGALAGSLLTRAVTPDLLRTAFGILLLISGAIAFLKQ